jgi:hypothetical protein
MKLTDSTDNEVKMIDNSEQHRLSLIQLGLHHNYLANVLTNASGGAASERARTWCNAVIGPKKEIAG